MLQEAWMGAPQAVSFLGPPISCVVLGDAYNPISSPSSEDLAMFLHHKVPKLWLNTMLASSCPQKFSLCPAILLLSQSCGFSRAEHLG